MNIIYIFVTDAKYMCSQRGDNGCSKYNEADAYCFVHAYENARYEEAYKEMCYTEPVSGQRKM